MGADGPQGLLGTIRYRLPEDATQPDIFMNKRIRIDELQPGMLIESSTGPGSAPRFFGTR